MSDKAVGRIRYVGKPFKTITHADEYSVYLCDLTRMHYFYSDVGNKLFLSQYPILGPVFEHVAPAITKSAIVDVVKDDGDAFVVHINPAGAMQTTPLDQVHLGDGIFITQADHEALQQMEKANNICLCGRFVGRTRLDAGLPDCTYCSAAAVRKQAIDQKLVRRGLDLEKANKIAFAGLTAHL